MKATVTLTVSESKRLIAKGIVDLACVQKAFKKGLIVIATGSTNSYIVEELLGKKIDKLAYITGYTAPKNKNVNLPQQKLPDVIFKNGNLVRNLNRFEAVKQMKEGDVFIKGANALNYEKKVAGILMTDLNGGTIGGCIGPVTARKANLIIPIGLEKLVANDIIETSKLFPSDTKFVTGNISLFPVPSGTIITEIEAIETLVKVKAFHIGSGGIFGAQGATKLLLEGTSQNLKSAINIIETIQGEPAL
ncbi:MAG: hypothetical protein AABY84_12600 [Candidatus Firestonebacteria bacterium]